MMTKQPEIPDQSTPKKPTKSLLIVRAFVGIILFDRWVMGSVRAIAAKKGPFIVIKAERPKRRRPQRKGKAAMKGKLFGWSMGAIVGIGVISVLAATAWGFIRAKIADATTTTTKV